jgi:hypothetical protein
MGREQLTKGNEPKFDIVAPGFSHTDPSTALDLVELERPVTGIVPGRREVMQQDIPYFASNCEGVCAH